MVKGAWRTRVGHFEGADVRAAGVQLPQIEIVEAPVPHAGIGCAGVLFPLLRAEKAVEIRNLIRVATAP
jgi:nitrogenase subunit NifH